MHQIHSININKIYIHNWSYQFCSSQYTVFSCIYRSFSIIYIYLMSHCPCAFDYFIPFITYSYFLLISCKCNVHCVYIFYIWIINYAFFYINYFSFFFSFVSASQVIILFQIWSSFIWKTKNINTFVELFNAICDRYYTFVALFYALSHCNFE